MGIETKEPAELAGQAGSAELAGQAGSAELAGQAQELKQELVDRILELHRKWLRGEQGGKRADLRGVNLRGADLTGAVLRGSDMRDCDLRTSNLYGANMGHANLEECDLHLADMHLADLSGSIMYTARLCGSDLSGANLAHADLTGVWMEHAMLSEVNLCNLDAALFSILPEGEIIGWKKCDQDAIVRLRIPEDARRSNATGRKCRCDKARVEAIWDRNGKGIREARSLHDPTFVYTLGQMVFVEDFCEDRWEECAPGIHFFITREEAVAY